MAAGISIALALNATRTLPTKRLTRPSSPTADGSRSVINGVVERSISGGGGAGGALAIAAAMTASISADVGVRVGEYERGGACDDEEGRRGRGRFGS
jgi:hypothetical protein